jgi:5'-3' exonuclease
MGIKGLRDLLKKQVPLYEEQVLMKDFSCKKVAVDASLFICVYKAARKELYEEAFITLLCTLLEQGIHPVFVFDGKSPEEKSKEKKKRAEKKDASIARIKKLEDDLEIYNKTGKISKDLEDINKKSLTTIVIKNKITLTFSVKKVSQYIEKLKSNILNVTEQDFRNVQELLTIFGIPFIVAKGEAEILCAEMAKQNIIDAVMTKDTDVLACSVPIMLYDINVKTKEFTQIRIQTIHKKLNLDETSWLDFCIMCGTDFNNNIPRVGPVRALNFIRKYKTIEELKINEPKLDISILSHEKTRDIFKCKDEKIPDIPNIVTPDIKKIEERIKEKKLKVSITTIRRQLGFDIFGE